MNTVCDGDLFVGMGNAKLNSAVPWGLYQSRCVVVSENKEAFVVAMSVWTCRIGVLDDRSDDTNLCIACRDVL